jgi:hypothetical protein
MLLDDLKNRFPNISTVTIDTYYPLYDTTYTFYYGVEYGTNSQDNEIILNLLAHLITVAESKSDGSNIQQVGSESVGSISSSYVSIPLDNNDKFFTSTIYGQTYMMLIRKNMGMHFV